MYNSDWHIHSKHSCDCASLKMEDLVIQAPLRGIREYGVTDHLHTPFNLPDIVESRADFLNNQRDGFHFGIEASVVSKWELEQIKTGKQENPVYGIREGGDPSLGIDIGITKEQIAMYKIEYVIGGTHWPMYVEKDRQAVIRNFHMQNMFLAIDSRVNIVAHPWWWHGWWQNEDLTYTSKPWLDDFKCIKKAYHNEFAAALVENNTFVEMNLGAMLLSKAYTEDFRISYAEYIRYLFEEGVSITIGSDCHSSVYPYYRESANRILRKVGFKAGDFSIPPLRRYTK